MGWPLLLALGAQAAQAESGSHDEKVARKYGELANQAEVEAYQREQDALKEDARKAAMARALSNTPQPLSGEKGMYTEMPNENPSWSRWTSGPAAAASTIGGYFGAKEPAKYPGAQGEPMTDSEWERYVKSQMGE